jgi:hypothetical protein
MNNPSSTASEYYKLNCAIPLVDHIISQLNCRFDKLIQSSSKIFRLLPSKICHMTNSELELLVNEIYDVYNVDLTTKADFKNEIQKWTHKWSTSSTDQPTNILDCLKTVKKDFNPNLFNLFKNYIVLPITTCECERCFSCLRRLKTYLRSTMLETRLSTLALMYVHRNIVTLPEDVVNMFIKCHNKNPLFN